MTKKIEVNEDDFKKVVLIMKYSKEFVKLDPKDLFLGNLWRVAPKLADKLAKKNGYEFVENKGRKTLKPISGTPKEEVTEEKPVEKPVEEPPVTTEKKVEDSEDDEEPRRILRHRKRKSRT